MLSKILNPFKIKNKLSNKRLYASKQSVCNTLHSLKNKTVQKSCKAYTLSEVMITIAIIGVVSVLVIPMLYQSTNNRELVSQYLKNHTVLTNAYKETEAVEGYKLYYLPIDEFRTLYESHLKTVECDEYDVCLADGTGFNYEIDDREYVEYITVDTNGIKKPNSPGKDIYKFKVTESGLIPYGENQEYCAGYDCGKYVLAYHKIFDGLINNCVAYSDGVCSQCQDGYRLDENTCNAIDTPNCTAYSGENCSSCIDGYSSNTNGTCTPSVANCLTHSENGCQTCESDYYTLNGSTCTEKPSYCLTIALDGSTCTLSNGTTGVRATIGGKDVYAANQNKNVNWDTAVKSCPNGTHMPTLSDLQNLRGQEGMPTSGWFWTTTPSSRRNYVYTLDFDKGSLSDSAVGPLNLLCVGDAE